MDVNGSRFHLLRSEDDWSRARAAGERVSSTSAPVRWSAARGEITLEPKTFRFVAGKGDRPVQIDDRRGAARDAFGNWYWIAPDRRSILARSVGSGSVSAFWPVEESCAPVIPVESGEFRPSTPHPSRPIPLQGLAVTEDHYLVVGTTEPPGVLIFDLYAGGAPRPRLWRADGAPAFAPFALAARAGGGVWILDRDDRRVWQLDRRFELVVDASTLPPVIALGAFTDATSDASRCDPPRRWERSVMGWKVPAGVDLISILALPGRGVLVLDRGTAGRPVIHWIELPNEAEPRAPAIRMFTLDPPSPPDALVAHDFALTTRDGPHPSTWYGELFVADGEGNQAYAFDVTVTGDHLSLAPIHRYFPMRLFGGRALVVAGNEPWYDCGDSWVKLVHQNRPRYVETGELMTPVFDSGEPGCIWHRLMLDACIPPGASIDVYSRASDDWRELTLVEWLTDEEGRAFHVAGDERDGEPLSEAELALWQPEPRPYLRGDGPELPYLPRVNGEGRGTWELLFQEARGRYAQVKLVLRGDGRSTPRVSALRAWYPRFSYRDRYLPAVYREDAESASFLERFLANLEGILTTVEDRIAAAQMLFDVESAPPEAVEWLGQWLGVALDPSWEDDRRRLFIRHAMEFFAVRGTVRGLQLSLRLALEECVDDSLFRPRVAGGRPSPVRIIERFRTRRTARALLGDVETSVPEAERLDPAVRWDPSVGAAELHHRYRKAVGLASGDLPLVGEDAPPAWGAFVEGTLGFNPRAGAQERAAWRRFLGKKHPPSDATASVELPHDEHESLDATADWREYLAETPSRERRVWHDFLARRYRAIGALNAAWGTRWSAFTTVALPDVVPANRTALADWFDFEGIVLPMHRTAHRFTVMLPIPLHMRTDTPAQRRRFAIARAVLDLEKPAHTVFEMRFYWAMFRLGEARIGEDTVIGQGSRAPELMAPMVLGQGYLAESFLAAHPGRDAPARLQVGRDRVGRSARLGGP